MARVKKLDGKGYLKDATGRYIQDYEFTNDPSPDSIEKYKMTPEEVEAEIERLGLRKKQPDTRSTEQQKENPPTPDTDEGK